MKKQFKNGMIHLYVSLTSNFTEVAVEFIRNPASKNVGNENLTGNSLSSEDILPSLPPACYAGSNKQDSHTCP